MPQKYTWELEPQSNSCVADYRRFLEAWAYAHSTDRDFQGLPFPPNHFELPSPQMLPGQASELPSPELSRSLDPVLEPEDQDPRG